MQGLIREASNLGDQDHDSSSGKNKLQKLEDALRETGVTWDTVYPNNIRIA